MDTVEDKGTMNLLFTKVYRARWLTPYQIAGDGCGDHSIWPIDEYPTHYQQDNVDGQVLSAIRPETKQLQQQN